MTKFVIKNHLGDYVQGASATGALSLTDYWADAKRFDSYGEAADWAQEHDVMGWEIEEITPTPKTKSRPRTW